MTFYPLSVISKRVECADAVSIYFRIPVDLKPLFRHAPGQFVTIETRVLGELLTRQYSISSLTDDDALRITVKKVPGGRMSTWLVDEVREGDCVDIAPPRGRFFKPAKECRRVILLAAGSGVAPMLAIARHLTLDGDNTVTLAVGNRYEDTIILRGDLDALPADVEHVLSRPSQSWTGLRGHIGPEFLDARDRQWISGSPDSVMIYLCGPQSFMDVAETHYKEIGIDPSRIRRESFDLILNDDDQEPGLAVTGTESPELDGPCGEIRAMIGGQEVAVAPLPGESVLAALLRIEADVPHSCQEGTCASCIAKLRSGCIEIRPFVLKTLRQDDLDEGVVLACLSRPVSDRVRIDFDDI